MESTYCDPSLPDGLKAMLDKSRIALSIADGQQDDFPLVGVNEAFCNLTGYRPEAVLNRNCRFLQPEGGAGPVRDRMRQFLQDHEQDQEKFVIPNEALDGRRFLNLVYMAKLRRGGEMRYILGSQFDATRGKAPALSLYEEALKEDIRRYNLLADDTGWVMLGSYDALANSHALIAHSTLDQDEPDHPI
ncbi:MAG: PAS domain-containing protein [Sphingomonadaceae bacterium]